MNISLFLVIAAVISLTEVSGEDDKARNDACAELRKLYSKTAPDSLSCVFKWGKEARAKCREEAKELKHTLMEKVRQYWLTDHYITAVGDKCVSGYANFAIGSFDDPVRLPCDEQAFVAPKHTDEEIDDMYRTLLKLYNSYDQVCLTQKCKDGKAERAKALAEKIKYAENEDMIPPKCQKSGTGWYSFYDGMQEVECPCIYTEPAQQQSTTDSTTQSSTDSTTSTA